jgi:hypothetical protein
MKALYFTALVLGSADARISEVSLRDLAVSGANIPDSFSSEGVFILRDSIDSTNIQRLAAGLAKCVHAEDGDFKHFAQRQTFDGAVRITHASKSNELFQGCDPETELLAAYFKDQSQLIGEAVAKLIDINAFSTNAGDDSGPIAGMIGDMSSDSLDHFHVYSSPETKGLEHHGAESASTDVSIPFHYDMGLFLVLTPEVWIGNSEAGARSDLVVRLQDGTDVHVIPSEPNSVIILVGSALSKWMKPRIPLKPCLHAVVPRREATSQKRVVLGRMFLPQMETISKSGVKFRDFFLSPLQGEESSNEEQRNWRRLGEIECEAGTKFCWMQCMPEIDCGGQESACRDPQENRNCLESECNDRCTLMCPERPLEFTTTTTQSTGKGAHVVPFVRSHGGPMHPRNNTRTPISAQSGSSDQPPRFCYGRTSMVMSGFQSVTSENASCIILFFEPWLLNSPLKFAFGCIGVFVLGLIIECAIKYRRYVTNDVRFTKSWTRELAVTSLFGLNVMLGYLAMLAAMTFNVELFISTVMGIAVGHSVFANSKQPVRETADPCCVTTEAAQPALVAETGLRNSTGACCCDR